MNGKTARLLRRHALIAGRSAKADRKHWSATPRDQRGQIAHGIADAIVKALSPKPTEEPKTMRRYASFIPLAVIVAFTALLGWMAYLENVHAEKLAEFTESRQPAAPNWEIAVVSDTPHGKERIAIMFVDGTNRVLVPRGFNLVLHGEFSVNGVRYTVMNNQVVRVK